MCASNNFSGAAWKALLLTAFNFFYYIFSCMSSHCQPVVTAWQRQHLERDKSNLNRCGEGRKKQGNFHVYADVIEWCQWHKQMCYRGVFFLDMIKCVFTDPRTLVTRCSCGSVVEHCISSAKGCGFDSQGTHILIKKNYSLNAM